MESAEDRLIAWIETAALGIELLAVALLVLGIALSSIIYIGGLIKHRADLRDGYERYRLRLGRALLLGLEILVAADVVRTVALESALQAILSLGALVLIRTFLSWSVVLEIEGRWPWARPSVETVEPTSKPLVREASH